MTLTNEELELLHETLDDLGLALAGHAHQWNPELRANYEASTKTLEIAIERAVPDDAEPIGWDGWITFPCVLAPEYHTRKSEVVAYFVTTENGKLTTCVQLRHLSMSLPIAMPLEEFEKRLHG